MELQHSVQEKPATEGRREIDYCLLKEAGGESKGLQIVNLQPSVESQSVID